MLHFDPNTNRPNINDGAALVFEAIDAQLGVNAAAKANRTDWDGTVVPYLKTCGVLDNPIGDANSGDDPIPVVVFGRKQSAYSTSQTFEDCWAIVQAAMEAQWSLAPKGEYAAKKRVANQQKLRLKEKLGLKSTAKASNIVIKKAGDQVGPILPKLIDATAQHLKVDAAEVEQAMYAYLATRVAGGASDAPIGDGGDATNTIDEIAAAFANVK